MAKYGMSLVALGLAGELRPRRIAVNALWPRSACRTPDILADAAHTIFLKDPKTFTGNFPIDDTFLFENGVRRFDRYRVDPTVDLLPGLFVPDDSKPPVSLTRVTG
jgi:citronellol/citronellal dehydrogenase